MFNVRAFSATTDFHGYLFPPGRLSTAAALSYIAHTLWICVRPTSGAAAMWFDSGKCQAMDI